MQILISELFTISKRWKLPKCHQQMNELNKIWHIHTAELFSHEKERSLILTTTWMDPKNLMLSEISQTQKKILYDSTYMQYLE